MTKWVNLRIPVVCALSLCAGVFTGIMLVYFYQSSLWLLLAIPLFALPLVLCLIFKFKLAKTAIFCAIALLLFIGGGFACTGTLKRFENNIMFDGGTYTVEGKVTDKGETSSGAYVIANSLTFDGNKVGGKIYVILGSRYGEFCDIGYTIKFTSKIDGEGAFEYAKLNNFAEKDIRYTAYVYSDMVSDYGFSLFGSVRSSVHRLLYDNLDEESAGVCYALLTGNTDGVEDSTLSNFRTGGVAHLFAVSGLHIGILYAIVNFITRKLRLNKYLRAIICLLTVFLYSGVCGFSLSSVRAAIMCAVSSAARLIYEKYDGLNALAVAVIIILFINPLHLFSVGFLLSVCAVGSIFILSPEISNILIKIKIPKKIASAAGVSFAAQLGTLPVMLMTFGYVSGAGLLLNLIVVPIMSVLYAVLLITTLICLIIPPSAVLISVAAAPIQAVLSFLVLYGFENSLITSANLGAFAPLYFIALAFASDKFNIKFIKKLIIVTCCAALFIASFLYEFYSPLSGYKITVNSDKGELCVIIKSRAGKVYVMTDKAAENPTRYIKENLNESDKFIILDTQSANLETILNLGNLYLFSDNVDEVEMNGNILHYGRDFNICGTDIAFVDKETVIIGFNDFNLGICAGENTLELYSDVFITPLPNAYCESKLELCTDNKNAPFNCFNSGEFSILTDGKNFTVSCERPPKQ